MRGLEQRGYHGRMDWSAARVAVFVLTAALAMPRVAAAQSEPALKFEHDEARDALVVHASIDIAATPAIVWAVIIDCNRAPKFVPNMESCRIVNRDPAGRWELRETVLNIMLLPRIRSLSRNDFEPPRRMAFKRAGGDTRIADGEWRLEPLAKGKATRLHYSAVLALNYSVPRFLVDNAAARDFPALLQGIEHESLEDAGKK
jgi:carbon monoxide dehydrogenase subunit G